MLPLLLSLIVAGANGIQAAPTNTTKLLARQKPGENVWTDDSGNTAVLFGNDKISFGNLDPMKALDTIYENCYEQGICNPEPWTLGFESQSLTYTLTMEAIEGQYVSWVRNGLVDAIKAAASAEGLIEHTTVQKCTGGGCVGCPWTCTDEDHWVFPSAVGVSYNFKEDTPDVINIRFSTDNDAVGADFCSKLLGAAGAVAGSVSGVAGGIFALGALACQ